MQIEKPLRKNEHCAVDVREKMGDSCASKSNEHQKYMPGSKKKMHHQIQGGRIKKKQTDKLAEFYLSREQEVGTE